MTTVKIIAKAGLSLFDKAVKRAEAVLKDASSIVGAYQLKEDPVKFAIDVLDFDPFPYQKDLLYDPSRRICACMGRQTGKSSTIACKAIHFAATRRRKTILIVSATLRQSMLMFSKIVAFIDSSKLVDAVKYRTRTVVEFTNGSSITALPCGNDGGTLRGYTADVIILDEASFMPEQVIANVVMPMIATTKGYCWMLSTPWDKCYSGDTDVMTESGWKNIKEIDYNDNIACLIDGKVEFHKPYEIVSFESDELIKFKSGRIDLVVTPSHRMYVKKQKGHFRFYTAQELAGTMTDLYFKTDFPWYEEEEREYFELPACDWFHIGGRSGKIVNKPRQPRRIRMDLWLEFFGYWLAEGTIFTGKKGHYLVSISQKSGSPIVKRVAQLCRDMGFNPHLYNYPPRVSTIGTMKVRSKGETRVTVYNKQLASYLSQIKQKHIPTEFKRLSKRQIRILIDSILRTDGRQVHGKRLQIFAGIYEQYTDDLQELALKLGYSSTKLKDGNMWKVSLYKDKIHKYRTYAMPIKRIRKKSKVYCLSVLGGLLFVRRNGHPCWSGNSHLFYRVFNDTRWSRYHLPSSVNPLIDHAFLEEQRELVGEERFAMEYLAEFIDDSNSYFPVSLIRQCVSEDVDLALEGELFAGYDPGGKQSYAAFVIVRRIDDKLYMVYKKAERGKPYVQFNAEIYDISKEHEFKLLVDQTGLGNPIVEHLKELGMNVEGLTLTDRTKEEVFSNLKILMEERKLLLPYDIELHNSLNAIEYERTRTGAFKFSKRNGTYDDLGYALALACFAAKHEVKGVIIKV